MQYDTAFDKFVNDLMAEYPDELKPAIAPGAPGPVVF